MDPKHHQLRVLDHRHPKDLRNPLKRILVRRKSIDRKKIQIFYVVTYARFGLIYILLIFACRDRKDKEKDEISRMPKAKDEQAPVSKIN